jgi:hypothetical protein
MPLKTGNYLVNLFKTTMVFGLEYLFPRLIVIPLNPFDISKEPRLAGAFKE